MVRAIITTLIDTLEGLAHREPVYQRTAIPEGLGAPITPESITVACEEALETANVPSGLLWTLPAHDGRDPRQGPIPAIAVMHRWLVGAPIQLWAAGGPCKSYPAAFLADFTLLEHDRAGAEREAKRRPQEAAGWRAKWERWFPSSRDPEIRTQDRAFAMPPVEYFRQPDGATCFREPRIPRDQTPEIV